MKTHIQHIGRLALAGCFAMMPAAGLGQDAAVSAMEAAATVPAVKAPATKLTVVGYDRSIRQQDFAGLGKPTVLRMQQQLEVIYRALPDWQRDFARRARPLDDGVVGPVTLLWLQRYSFNFKFPPGADIGKRFPAHMERMAAFAQAHPAELEILLGAGFEEWDRGNPKATQAQDFAVRSQGDAAALLKLVERYRASRVPAAPSPVPVAPNKDGYYSYLLTGGDFDLLGGKGETVAVLAKFKDVPYRSKEALKVAVEQKFEGRSHVFDKVWPAIDHSVQMFDGYSLSPATLAALKKAGMAASRIDEVAAFGTVYFKSRDTFESYVAEKIAAGETTLNDDEIAQLVDAAKVFDNYHLDQQALDTIAKQLSGSIHVVGVPAAVVDMLKQITDVDYPESGIFHSAARAKIALGLGMCKANLAANNAYLASLAISNDQLAALEKELSALQPASLDGESTAARTLSGLFAQISALKNKPDRCSETEKKEATEIVKRLYDAYLWAPIESAGRKKMPDDIAAIKVTGDKCGCALDEMAGVVYGFYPYWWKELPKSLNFRVLNRIAYYGLTVDDAGEFHLGSRSYDLEDGSEAANAFVLTARKYNSKVDWLIQKNDWGPGWRGLDTQGKKAIFNRILRNISTLLNAPLTNMGARVKRMASFASVDPPRRGDGVTLYFPNYPDGQESIALFNEFYRALRVEMDKYDLGLNIMVAQDALATEPENAKIRAFGLPNMIALRKERPHTEQYVRPGGNTEHEFLLVLLNEPTAESKKLLRLSLENDAIARGAERADFLRGIVPVIHFDDRNWQQLDDDIVYARDNFAGVGFWAPDFDNLAQEVNTEAQSCVLAKQIAVCLLKNFREVNVSNSIPGPVELFTCVNRWVLHWIMLFLLATAIVLIGLFFTFCKVQGFIKKHFLWVQMLTALPALLIFILLLLYDPFMLVWSKGNLPFYISAGIIMIGIGVGYWFWRAQRHVPQRERGMPQREGKGFPILGWSIESDKRGLHWLIKNRGSGYAIIKKVEILLDGHPVADARTALESVLDADNSVQWKSVPLVGQKLEPGQQLAGLSIANSDAARIFEKKLKERELAVKITYSGPSNEHWSSDGAGIMSVPGML